MTVGRRRGDPTMLILLGLGVLWAAVLVPPLLRSRVVAAGPTPVGNNGSGQLDVYNLSLIHI